ncbi:MAG: O-antigen ligase family protein [Acidobacteriota bacterium]
MTLTAYAAIATVWGPFPLAGSKLVANMAGILMAIVVLEKAARLGLLTSHALQVLIWGSMALAVVQTYYFGGATYGFDGSDQVSRLSSFIAAQQFAAFLVAFLTLALWHSEFGVGIRVLTAVSVLTALLLNGSRVWFLGALFITLFYMLVLMRQRVILVGLFAGALVTSILLFMSFNSNTEVIVDNSSNRIVATLSAIATGSDTSNRVGLRDLTFRTAIYTGIINDISSSGLKEFALGHGTSSGANGVMRVFPNSYDAERLDPNRLIHNEWLRAAYEWGVVGLLLLAGVFSTMIGGLVSICRAQRRNHRALAALSFVPAFLLAFSSENVLASAGNAMTLSLAIMLALLWTPSQQTIDLPVRQS